MGSLAKNTRKFNISVKSAPQMTTVSPQWVGQRQKIVYSGRQGSYLGHKVD